MATGIMGAAPAAVPNLYDPSNATHVQAAKDLAAGMQTMIASGDESGAKALYNQKQAQYGFTDAQFAPATANMGVAGASGFTADNVNEWKANPVRGVPAPAPSAPSAPAFVPAQAATLAAPTPWNVTPNQTVQSQVKDIIDANSPLMQQARTGALQQANARGLINSSIAVEAGQNAVLNAALPIGTSDAGTYAKSAGYNADQSNQFATKQFDAANQMSIANLQAQTSLSVAQINHLADSERTQLSIAADWAKAQLSADTNLTTNANNLSAQAQQNYQANLKSYQTGYANTLYNNSVNKDMTPAARAIANENAFTLMKDQYKTEAAVAGLPDVSDMLVYIPGPVAKEKDASYLFTPPDL